MTRSQRKMKEALDKFNNHTNQYRYLSGIGDKRMSKARREANKARENWIDPERLDSIMEDEEPSDDNRENVGIGGQKHPAPKSKTQETNHGRVKKLIEYFDKLGGP